MIWHISCLYVFSEWWKRNRGRTSSHSRSCGATRSTGNKRSSRIQRSVLHPNWPKPFPTHNWLTFFATTTKKKNWTQETLAVTEAQISSSGRPIHIANDNISPNICHFSYEQQLHFSHIITVFILYFSIDFFSPKGPQGIPGLPVRLYERKLPDYSNNHQGRFKIRSLFWTLNSAGQTWFTGYPRPKRWWGTKRTRGNTWIRWLSRANSEWILTSLKMRYINNILTFKWFVELLQGLKGERGWKGDRVSVWF